jgi:hypothetical protein
MEAKQESQKVKNKVTTNKGEKARIPAPKNQLLKRAHSKQAAGNQTSARHRASRVER